MLEKLRAAYYEAVAAGNDELAASILETMAKAHRTWANQGKCEAQCQSTCERQCQTQDQR